MQRDEGFQAALTIAYVFSCCLQAAGATGHGLALLQLMLGLPVTN